MHIQIIQFTCQNIYYRVQALSLLLRKVSLEAYIFTNPTMIITYAVPLHFKEQRKQNKSIIKIKISHKLGLLRSSDLYISEFNIVTC